MQNSRKDTGLNVRPRRDSESYNGFPQFEKPQPVGYFSLQGLNYEDSQQQLRYFKQPPAKSFPLDLNIGLEMAIKKPGGDVQVDGHNILKFIFNHRERFCTTNKQTLNVEFVCCRGLLRLIMCTPYERRQDWRILVTRYRGTFYLYKRWTEQEQSMWRNKTEQQKISSAWGFKFEQYCLTENFFSDPDTSKLVDETSEFSCMFRTMIGDMSILYAAEMDGIISEQPVNLDENPNLLESLHFIELKTQRVNSNSHFKMRNWWCQSFLVGVKDIYVGMRNDTGLVQSIEHIDTRSLHPKDSQYWTGASCANFLKKFFSYLKKLMADVNCPDTVYEFYFEADSARIKYEIFEGKSEHTFLPDWYVDMLQPTT